MQIQILIVKIMLYIIIKKRILIPLFSLCMVSFTIAQNITTENDLYKISIPTNYSKNPRFVVTQKASGISREIKPKVYISFSKDKPQLASVEVDGYSGTVGWKTNGNKFESNIFNLPGKEVTSSSVNLENKKIVFDFKNYTFGKIKLVVCLPGTNESPSITMSFDAATDGWYSIGFTGLAAVAPEKLDFLYQPATWSWKRFPTEPCMTEESHATTAATFINTSGFTEGIAPAIEMIPYRFALQTCWSNKENNIISKGFAYTNRKGNSLFGLQLRNSEGLAQPMVFAPLLGGEKSYMKAKQQFSFTLKYLLTPGDWIAGTEFLFNNICKYKNERQNATVSLNKTFENMVDFGMNDRLSGWEAEYKAFNYRFDAPGTVKIVSAIHALGIALSTGDYEVYKRRALPMMEYVMSRQKFLFSIDTTQLEQNPSHFLKGPCVEIGELSGLYQMTNGNSAVFKREADRIFGQVRKLNTDEPTGGGSWKDYLAQYKMTKNKEYLKKAKAGGLEYIKENLTNYPTAPVKKFFQIDFGPNFFDLYEIWEATGEKVFLDAAHTAARHLILWTRSNPMAPDSLITVNKGGFVEGVFPGRREVGSNQFVLRNETSRIAEQKIPAWRTSLVGTIPEAIGTYTYGPIMLTNYAPYFLRIAKETGDKLLANAAYNAVLGRYANFPGYYFTSLHTNVYQGEDYPLHDFYDIKYNAIFYNHIWSHIALINDFIVSDAFYRSAGKVDFPSEYAPGYAFLTNKVYGSNKGEIYGNRELKLWLPANALQNSNVAINHLFGVGKDALYLVLMNTSSKNEVSEIQLNQDKITYDTDKKYFTVVYGASGNTSSDEMVNGKLSISIPAGSITTVKIEGLELNVPLFMDYEKAAGNSTNNAKSYIRIEKATEEIGTITGMMINLTPTFSDAYIYSDVLETIVSKVTLKYRIGNAEWQQKVDAIYPYEFSIHLDDPKQPILFKWLSEGVNGKVSESKEMELSN